MTSAPKSKQKITQASMMRNPHLMRAVEASERALPSSEPGYWAKPGCKHCYGRGIIGTITTNIPRDSFGGRGNKSSGQLKCSCVDKRFSAWRDKFVDAWLVENPESATPAPTAEPTTDQSQLTTASDSNNIANGEVNV